MLRQYASRSGDGNDSTLWSTRQYEMLPSLGRRSPRQKRWAGSDSSTGVCGGSGGRLGGWEGSGGVIASVKELGVHICSIL